MRESDSSSGDDPRKQIISNHTLSVGRASHRWRETPLHIIPTPSFQLNNVQRCVLSGVQLTSSSPALKMVLFSEHLPQLEILDLSRNYITTLALDHKASGEEHSNIGTRTHTNAICSSLRHLDLSHNQLRTLPVGFHKACALAHISLRSNHLRCVD